MPRYKIYKTSTTDFVAYVDAESLQAALEDAEENGADWEFEENNDEFDGVELG